jgi:uncharacterized membrane protein
MASYLPPEQGRAGQIVDTVFILLLVFGALFLPIQLGLTGGGTIIERPIAETWEGLHQTPAMQEQWVKLGFTPAAASKYITERFDYRFRPISLLSTFVVIAAYFVFLFWHSEKEFREVIREKFDEHE